MLLIDTSIYPFNHPFAVEAWVKRAKEDVRRHEDGVTRLFLGRPSDPWDVSNESLPPFKYSETTPMV